MSTVAFVPEDSEGVRDGGRDWAGTFGEGTVGSSMDGDGGLDLDGFLDVEDNNLVKLFCFFKGLPAAFTLHCRLEGDNLPSPLSPMILRRSCRKQEMLSKTARSQLPKASVLIATGYPSCFSTPSSLAHAVASLDESLEGPKRPRGRMFSTKPRFDHFQVDCTVLHDWFEIYWI